MPAALLPGTPEGVYTGANVYVDENNHGFECRGCRRSRGMNNLCIVLEPDAYSKPKAKRRYCKECAGIIGTALVKLAFPVPGTEDGA